MKWTPENDQLLFMKLLETHDISVKFEKIKEAWPKDRGEAPTARAIQERIAKIRSMVKAQDGTSAPATPRKRAKPTANADTDTVPGAPTPSKRRKSRTAGTLPNQHVKPEPADFGEFTNEEYYDNIGMPPAASIHWA